MNQNISKVELKLLQKIRTQENDMSSLAMSLKKLVFKVQDSKLNRNRKKQLIFDRKAIEVKEINELCNKMKLKDEKITYLQERITNLEEELDLSIKMKSTDDKNATEAYIQSLEQETSQQKEQLMQGAEIQDELVERVRQLECELQNTRRESEILELEGQQNTARASKTSEVLSIKGNFSQLSSIV